MRQSRYVRVGDLMELVRRPIEVDPTRGYVEIGIRSYGQGIFHKEPVDGSSLGSKRVFEIHSGELIFNTVFAWEGAVAVATEQDVGTIGSHRFMTYQVDPTIADLRYLYYLFQSEPGLGVVRAASPGSAGRNRTLGIRAFAEQHIPLPDLVEQRRIAATLDSARILGEEVESRSAEAEAYVTHLLSALTTLSCPRAPIGAVAHRVSRPVVPAPQELYTLLGVRWYGKGPFVRERRYGSEVSAPKLYRVEDGDFIYNRLFGWKGAFGFAAEDFFGGFVSGEFPCYRGNEGLLLTEYLHAVCSAETFWGEAQELSRGATPTSRNRLREDEFEAIEIPVPSIEAQERVVQSVRLLSQLRTTTERRDRLVGALQSSLLNAAFSGRL